MPIATPISTAHSHRSPVRGEDHPDVADRVAREEHDDDRRHVGHPAGQGRHHEAERDADAGDHAEQQAGLVPEKPASRKTAANQPKIA